MNATAEFAGRVMLIGILVQGPAALGQDEPLHTLIDEHLRASSGWTPPRSSDAEFLRRVSLDLVGMPPTADEARAFLTDPAADKRQRLIERLFASPQFARHLATTLDLMLMERRPFTHVTADEWQAWLMKAVRGNMPWNELARQILGADGDDPAQRPAARFALDRASDPHALTRDIGRIFFGRDLQCAQCHDHPLVSDYLQSDYHGLLAFVSPSYAVVRKEGDKQTTVQAERAGSDLTFQSVFVGKPRRTGARMPGGVAIDEPFLLPGEDYEVAPAENVKSVPKFSRRAKLAELATDGTNRAFNLNIANRLWAHMLGRGLVHPVDWHHPDNAAIDPELLELLGERFAAMQFDIRAFLREIALSATYQRAYDLPTELMSLSSTAAGEVERLEAARQALQQAADASTDAYQKASEAWEQAESQMLPAAGELDAARAKYGEAKQKFDEATRAATDAKTQLDAKQSVAGPLEQAATAAEQAAKALADDKELAEAAQKFVVRSQQVKAELAVLKKTVEEKSAVVGPTTEAWNSTKPVVASARSKVEPLSASVRQAEREMLAARTKAEHDAEVLAALDRRVETARGLARLEKLHVAIAAADAAVAGRASELGAAQADWQAYGPVVEQHEAMVGAVSEDLRKAIEAMNAATAEHGRRLEVVQAIEAAVAATEQARQKVPQDGSLAEALKNLADRLSLAYTETADSQRHIDAAQIDLESASAAVAAAEQSRAEATAERSRRESAVAAAQQALDVARSDAGAKRSEFDAAVAELTDEWTKDFTLASLKPLTPEQLCWTVLRVTGVYDRHWRAEIAELDKAKPLSDEQKNDPAQVAARDVELEQRTYDKLKGNLATFVQYYGAAAGQPQGDFFATADQALFVENGGAINSWVKPEGDNVTERIVRQSDPRSAAEELYLAVLTRLPTEEETAQVAEFLSKRGDDRNAAAAELVWGLMNSAEFRFNH